MVGMVVRNENLTDIDPIRGQQLLAQVRPAVDQQPLAIAFNQDRGAGAAVPGSDGSQRPQSLPIRGTPVDVPQPSILDLHAAALLNSLKKLAVVAGPARRAARRAGRTGRRRCPRRTPARVLPRFGTGARNGESVSTSSRSSRMFLAVSLQIPSVLEGDDARNRDIEAEG